MANTTPNKELVPQPEIDKVLRFDEAIKLLRGDLVSLLPDAQAASKALSGVVGYKELQQGVAQVEELKKRVQSLETELTKLKNSQKQAVQEIMKADSDQVKSAKQVSAEIAKQGKATDELAAKVDNYRQKSEQVSQAQERQIDTSAKLNAEINNEKTQVEDLRTVLDTVIGSREENIALLNEYQLELAAVKAQRKQLTKDEQEGTLKVRDLTGAREALLSREIELKERIGDVNQVLRAQTKEMIALDGTSQRSAKTLEVFRITARKMFEDQQNSPEYAMILQNINELDTKLKGFDATLGNHQRHVGGYTEGILSANKALSLIDYRAGAVMTKIRTMPAIKKAWSKATEVLTKNLKMSAVAAQTFQFAIVGLAVAGIMVAINYIKKWREEQEKLKEVRQDFIKSVTEETMQIKLHFDNLAKATEGTNEYAKAKKAIIDKYGEYLNGQKEEIRNLTDQKAALKAVTAAIMENARAKALAATYEEAVQKFLDKSKDSFDDVLKSIKHYYKEAGLMGEELENAVGRDFQEYQRLVSESGGKMTQELQEFVNKINKSITTTSHTGEYYSYTVRDITGETKKLVKNTAELDKTVEQAESIYSVFSGTLDDTATKSKSLIKDQEELLKQAKLMPESTEAEITAKNKKIKAIETEISRLKSLGVETKKQQKDQEKLKKDEAKAVRDYALLLIQNDADTRKTIAENDKKSYGDRINALNSYLEIQSQSIKKDADNQIQAKIEELKALGMTEEQAREALKNQIILINAKAQAELTKLTEAGEKTRESITKDYADKQIKDISDRATEAARAIEKKESASLMALAKLYSEGNILHEEYQAEKTRIARQAAQERLDAEIGFLEEQLSTLKSSDEEYAKIKEKIDDAKLKYSTEVEKQITEDYYENAKKREEIEKQLAQTRKQILQEVFNFASALSDRWTQQELDRLEKASERNEDWANEETDRIDRLEQSGAISKEQAQARKDVIDQQAEEKEKELEQKRVEAQKKQAKFQKSLSALQIIISTAQAVMAAFAQAGPIAGIPLAAAMTALGAVQLATALAQPIPEYAKGTKDHPGGPAVIGDGGRPEMVVTPGGSVLRTPSKPTIWDMPAGTMVLPDYEKAIAALAFTALPGMNDKGTDRVISFGELVQGNKEMVKSINRFMSSYERGKGEHKHNSIVNNISKSRKWS